MKNSVSVLRRPSRQSSGRLMPNANAAEKRSRPLIWNRPSWPMASRIEPGRLVVDVLQECARHLGHLDVVRELIDGERGE